jgi:hypothetical protein
MVFCLIFVCSQHDQSDYLRHSSDAEAFLSFVNRSGGAYEGSCVCYIEVQFRFLVQCSPKQVIGRLIIFVGFRPTGLFQKLFNTLTPALALDVFYISYYCISFNHFASLRD